MLLFKFRLKELKKKKRRIWFLLNSSQLLRDSVSSSCEKSHTMTRSSLGSPSVNRRVILALPVCWKTGSLFFFLSLCQLTLSSKLSICLRFDYTIVCVINRFFHREVFLDRNPYWHIRHHKTHSPLLWKANNYWCSNQWFRMLILVLYLASHWSYLCPTLNIAWLYIYVWSLFYGLEVRCWLCMTWWSES